MGCFCIITSSVVYDKKLACHTKSGRHKICNFSMIMLYSFDRCVKTCSNLLQAFPYSIHNRPLYARGQCFVYCSCVVVSNLLIAEYILILVYSKQNLETNGGYCFTRYNTIYIVYPNYPLLSYLIRCFSTLFYR